MDGTLFGSDKAGEIQGEILWTNIETPGFCSGLSDTELVRRIAGPMDLHFHGYRVDRPFTMERHRLVLSRAAEFGVFRGATEAYRVRDCQLAGTYQVVTERV